MTEEYKPRRYPVEIQLLDHSEEGGILAADAKGFPADAFLIMRYVIEEDGVKLAVSARNGATNEALAVSPLFTMLVSLMGFVAAQPTRSPEEQAMVDFTRKMLSTMRMVTEMANGPPPEVEL